MGLEVQPAPGSKIGMEGEVQKVPPAPGSKTGMEVEEQNVSPSFMLLSVEACI